MFRNKTSPLCGGFFPYSTHSVPHQSLNFSLHYSTNLETFTKFFHLFLSSSTNNLTARHSSHYFIYSKITKKTINPDTQYFQIIKMTPALHEKKKTQESTPGNSVNEFCISQTKKKVTLTIIIILWFVYNPSQKKKQQRERESNMLLKNRC